MKIIIGRKKTSMLLLEGRKENAMAMIVKKINDPALREFLVDTILNNIIVADPTSNKKYIEWAARRMSEVARKEEDDRHILAMNQASQDPDGFLPGGPGDKEYTPERLEIIQGYTDQQRYQGGYLTNQERYLRHLDDAKVNIENRARVIVVNLKKYHKFAERNLMDKNLDKYKELYEWEHEVYKAEKEEREREEMKRREKGAKESTDYLHDDDDYMIVRPRSEDSSCYYGRGTRWCISATQSRNYFDQYTGEGAGFYFVLFKHLPQDDEYKKLALVFTAGSSEPSEVFDVVDDEVGVDAVTDAVRFNIFAEALKKTKTGQQIKKLKGPGRVESYKQAFKQVIDEYDDFVRTDSIEDKYSLQEVLLELELSEGELTNENADLIQEHVDELVFDQQGDIIGQAIAHFEENPGGPTDADFDDLMEKHKYDYLYVTYDMYDESRYYWDGGFSISIQDIHEDLLDADIDDVADLIRKILDDYSVYPDEVEGYGSDVSIRFNPDYDETEGLNGFENFLNRMDDYDQALHKILDEDIEETRQTFIEAGLLAGVGMTSLKERFDNLELESFEIDIEERELSIYRSMDITVPIPDRLYRGLTDDRPSWQTENRGEISKSPSLQAFDAMIKQRQTEHSDELIKQIVSVFDQVFKLYVQKMRSTLPGFEREARTQQEYGLLVPEYNVGVYRKSGVPQVGPSGLILGYFLDVRIEADEEESLEEENLKLIEMFLRKIDNEIMVEKIRNRFETIVQNDVIKNIIPEFKEEGEEPEIDPRTGKVTSKSERESEEYKKEQAVDELSTMFEILKESLPFGGYSPGLAGQLGPNLGTSLQPHQHDKKTAVGRDLSMSAKIVLSRNGKVLLIKNHKGWDLPGGHIKEDENVISGLMREVFEETGITLGEEDVHSLNKRSGNKVYFCGEFANDDVVLSKEHYEYGFFTINEIRKLKDLVSHYKKVIEACLGEKQTSSNKKKLLIKLGV